MSGNFNLGDYMDVAERRMRFFEAYPEGSLQSHIDFVEGGVLCVAEAYRTPDDIRPGVGHAFEPIPGKTPYTKDSEVMNSETSAWGRAILAVLPIDSKKIASADEVRARQPAKPKPEFKTPKPKPPDEEAMKLAAELMELTTQIGMSAGTAEELVPTTEKLIEKHAGDNEWLKRQIKTAKTQLETLAPTPF